LKKRSKVFIDMRKIMFTNDEISQIEFDYLVNELSCIVIGKKFGISKRPIIAILKERGKLRKGFSDGKKIKLTDEEMGLIKTLYVDNQKTSPEISKILGLSVHLVEKMLYKSDFRRTKGESISLRQTGKKRSELVKNNIKIGQQNFAKSGKRKQTGGVCKTFVVNGIKCHGTYERFYIEKLIIEGKNLPNNRGSIETPFGAYYPDFSFNNKLIEIKSDYTYEILLGNTINRFTKKIDKTQYKKIKWVNENVIPIEIIIVDKKSNKLIKKQII